MFDVIRSVVNSRIHGDFVIEIKNVFSAFTAPRLHDFFFRRLPISQVYRFEIETSNPSEPFGPRDLIFMERFPHRSKKGSQRSQSHSQLLGLPERESAQARPRLCRV